jgi:nucleotide-binding universal stress UspA family protein
MDRLTNSSKQCRRILVPLDGSAFAEEALAYAMALATHDSHVLLLRVIPGERENRSPKDVFGGSTDDELRKNRKDALEYLVATATKLREEGAPVRPVASVAVGTPAEQIATVAFERGYNLIVMSSHGRGAVGRIAYGSVADRVARTSHVPVLITRPRTVTQISEHPSIRRLVVPLDGSNLAQRALPVAVSLAIQTDSPILLVSVVDVNGSASPFVAYPAALGIELYHEAMVGTEEAMKKQFEKIELQLRTKGLKVESRVLHGPIGPSIMAETTTDDLVVMTSHGRAGVSRFLLGSVAEKLVRECQAPVLLVPPATSLATADAYGTVLAAVPAGFA